MSKFEEFYNALVEAGFEDSNYTKFCLFDGDELPDEANDSSLTYEQLDEVFNEVASRFGYEHVDQDGGGEGGSEYCYGVCKIDNTFYKAEWSYYSYHGYSFDYIESTIKEVTPVEKTVIVYE